MSHQNIQVPGEVSNAKEVEAFENLVRSYRNSGRFVVWRNDARYYESSGNSEYEKNPEAYSIINHNYYNFEKARIDFIIPINVNGYFNDITNENANKKFKHLMIHFFSFDPLLVEFKYRDEDIYSDYMANIFLKDEKFDELIKYATKGYKVFFLITMRNNDCYVCCISKKMYKLKTYRDRTDDNKHIDTRRFAYWNKSVPLQSLFNFSVPEDNANYGMPIDRDNTIAALRTLKNKYNSNEEIDTDLERPEDDLNIEKTPEVVAIRTFKGLSDKIKHYKNVLMSFNIETEKDIDGFIDATGRRTKYKEPAFSIAMSEAIEQRPALKQIKDTLNNITTNEEAIKIFTRIRNSTGDINVIRRKTEDAINRILEQRQNAITRNP